MSPARPPDAGRRPAGIARALGRCLAAAALSLSPVALAAGVPAFAEPQPPASSASAAPGSTSLTVAAAVSGQGVVAVSGTLVGADGRPLGRKVVSITVDDAMMGDATTASNGSWSTRVNLPQSFPNGTHQVVALYLDAGFDGPVSAATTLQVGNLPETKLTATPAETTVGHDQSVTVSGRLTTASGRPLPDCAIVVGAPDATGAATTAVTQSDGSFVVDYAIHGNPGDQRIPVRFDGDDTARASSTSMSVTVTDRPAASATPAPSPSAVQPLDDSGPGDVQPPAPTAPLPAKQRAELTSGPLTSGTNLAIGGVGLLALLSSLAMLGRSMAPERPREESVRLIDR